MNCSSHWPPREIANQARLHCREWWALCSDIWRGFVRTTNISAQVTRTTGKIIQQTNSAHCQLCSNYRTSSVLNLVHDFFSSCISLFTYRKEEASARIKKKKRKPPKSNQPVSESSESSLFFFLFSHWIWRAAHDFCPGTPSLSEAGSAAWESSSQTSWPPLPTGATAEEQQSSS